MQQRKSYPAATLATLATVNLSDLYENGVSVQLDECTGLLTFSEVPSSLNDMDDSIAVAYADLTNSLEALLISLNIPKAYENANCLTMDVANLVKAAKIRALLEDLIQCS